MQVYQVGQLPDGREVRGFLLTNALGMQARIIEYGGILTEMHVPDAQGRLRDIVIGFPSLAGYLGSHPYIGAVVGRYANRIRQAQFELDGKNYHLTANEGSHQLHGGFQGLDKKCWEGSLQHLAEGNAVKLVCQSAHGEEGFPGNVEVAVTYILTPDGSLIIRYEAKTDAPTILNLTQHAYFNLEERGSVEAHMLQLQADTFTPGDSDGLPLGEVRPVYGAYDFRQPKSLGRDLHHSDLAPRRGYDHNFVINGDPGTLRKAASVWSLSSGISLETWTTAPCIQLYSGNWLQLEGEKRGGTVKAYEAFCLETQFAPDSPNQPTFAQPVLRPEQPYFSETQYRFSLV